MTAEEQILRPGKLRWTAMLLGSALFAAGSVGIVQSGAGGWGVAGVALFAIAIVVALVQLFTPLSYLRLTPSGFTVSNLGKRRATAWDEVESFSTVSNYVRGFKVGESVRVAHASSYLTNHHVARAIITTMGYTLPDNYGMKARDLAALMNSWRQRYAH